MTLVMRCEDRERLVSYLYDDGSDTERAAVEAHLARCAACATELAELRAVRASLADWQPPESALGFRITRDSADPPARVGVVGRCRGRGRRFGRHHSSTPQPRVEGVGRAPHDDRCRRHPLPPVKARRGRERRRLCLLVLERADQISFHAIPDRLAGIANE